MELTLDQIIEGVKVGVLIVGGSVCGLASILGGFAETMKLAETKYLIGLVRKNYNERPLDKKPTYLKLLYLNYIQKFYKRRES